MVTSSRWAKPGKMRGRWTKLHGRSALLSERTWKSSVHLHGRVQRYKLFLSHFLGSEIFTYFYVFYFSLSLSLFFKILGENVEPFCRKINCGTELRSASELRSNCAPVFYESQTPQTSCNYAYRCGELEKNCCSKFIKKKMTWMFIRKILF